MPEPLFGPDGDETVMIPLADLSRSQARYQGYLHLNWEYGIGAFYPSDYRVSRAWLRENRGRSDADDYPFTHERCKPDAEGAKPYWLVEHRERRKVWRDGAWRVAA